MKHLWLFYPENDIALAHNIANFTAPPAAVKLRLAGEMLPLWMASDGDAIMCSGVYAKWLADISQQFGLSAMPWNHDTAGMRPTPWGWSKAARKFFSENGFGNESLPTDEAISHYRNLSHRRSAAFLSQELQSRLQFNIWPGAVEVTDVSIIDNNISQHSNVVIKSPWSSSGRGVLFANCNNREQVLRQASGMIRRQGSVMVEQYANRLMDFAMLFKMENGECIPAGLSLFTTDRNGSYNGNFVGSQADIKSRITKLIPTEQFDAIANELPNLLSNLLSGYNGPVGVDMLIGDTANGPIIHPTVEINLRYTMGFVALSLAKFVEHRAIFKVTPGDISKECHPIIHNKKLTGGSLALTPPCGDFSFILETTD